MQITYSKKNESIQKKTDSSASAVVDNSIQCESLQRKANMANNAAQRAETPRPNNTGMPDNLKSGIESLSGFSMDDVRVHYNSSKPATVQALAYTQGTDIHVAPGQEKHLPHEAWHVAQQMAGRVSPTTNINGMPVNDNAALEHEADVMGEKAEQSKMFGVSFTNDSAQCSSVQRMAFYNPNSPSETTQIEGDAETAKIFNREVGIGRNSELARYVDQFKKEMLTYIACCIQEKGIKNDEPIDYGPHISVVITGGKWYIAINSDYVKNIEEKGLHPQNMLLADAQSVQLDISEKWGEIHEWFVAQKTTDASSSMFSSDPSGEFAKKQALYIVYRWAGKNKGVVVEQNQKKNEGVIHGEMETLDYLQKKEPEWKLNFFIRFLRNHRTEFDEESLKNELQGKSDEDAIAYLSSLVSVTKDDITKCLNIELQNRVIRVGGTKTACLDCHYEMGGKCEHAYGVLIKESDSKKELVFGDCLKQNCEVDGNNPNLDPSGKPIMSVNDNIHANIPSKKVIKERTVVTMTPEHGMGYKGWLHPDSADLKKRKTGYHNCDVDEYEEQSQDYDELFITAESVLPLSNKMLISESIISLWEKRVDDLEMLNRHNPKIKLDALKNLETGNEQKNLEPLIQSFKDLKEMKNEYIDAFVCYLDKLAKENLWDDVKKGLKDLLDYEKKLLVKLESDVEKQKKTAMMFFERNKKLENRDEVCFANYRLINLCLEEIKTILPYFARIMGDLPNVITVEISEIYTDDRIPKEKKDRGIFHKNFFTKSKKLRSFLSKKGIISQEVDKMMGDLKPSNMDALITTFLQKRVDLTRFKEGVDYCYSQCNESSSVEKKNILESASNTCQSLDALYNEIERNKNCVSVLLKGLGNGNDDLLLRITMLMDRM